MPPTTLLEPADNPYRSTVTWNNPASRRGYTDDELIELRTFVGPKADHFLRKWLPRLEDPQNGDVGFSWISLFLPPLWFGYRKMYKHAVLLTIITCALVLAQQVLFVNVLELETVPPGVDLIVAVMANFVCGLYGNAWYLNHAEAAIGRARQEGLVGEQMLLVLARRGGTSILGLLGMWLFGFVAGIATGVLLFVMRIAA